MNKALILKQFGGSEEDFYNQYPTEEAYMMAMGGVPNFMNTGAPDILNSQFFNHQSFMEQGGQPCYECGGMHKYEIGGLSDDYIKKAHTKPGGSNVGKYNPNQTFAGPSGGSPKGSYPIGDIGHARAALRLAHNAPNPEGIKSAVYRKYPELKSAQFGGFMTEDLEGQYPMFNYGGGDNEDMHQMPDGTWMSNNFMQPGGTPDYSKYKSGILDDPYSKYIRKNNVSPANVDAQRAKAIATYNRLSKAGYDNKGKKSTETSMSNYDEMMQARNFLMNTDTDTNMLKRVGNEFWGGVKDMYGLGYTQYNEYGGDSSIPAINDKQYLSMFKDVIKKAMGGPAFPGETQEDIVGNKKQSFLDYIKLTTDEALMEEAAKKQYEQMMQPQNPVSQFMPQERPMIQAQAGMTFNSDEDEIDYWASQNNDYWENMFKNQIGPPNVENLNNNTSQANRLGNQGQAGMYGPNNDYWNFKGASTPNFTVPIQGMNSQMNYANRVNENNFGLRQDPNEIMDRRPPTDAMAHGDSYGAAQGQEGSLNRDRVEDVTSPEYDLSFKLDSGPARANRLLTRINMATGIVKAGSNKEIKDAFKRKNYDPNNFMGVDPAGNRGKWTDGRQFSGNAFDPYNSVPVQFQGKFGGTMENGGEASNFWTASQEHWFPNSSNYSEPEIRVSNTLTAVDRDVANLEAEGGETAVVNQGGIPAHFNIKGPRHTAGGVPLNLPDDSFIFSDTKDMLIKDPIIQAQFGMAFKKGGYTPADIAKKYNINYFRGLLAQPDSDKLTTNTAEAMIANYNLKLAKLGLVQEAKKGFPQGLPSISLPYIESMQINPADMINTQGEQEHPLADNMAKFGGLIKAQPGLGSTPSYGSGPQLGKGVYQEADPNKWLKAASTILEGPQRGMMAGITGVNALVHGEPWNVQYSKDPKTGQIVPSEYGARAEMPGETILRNDPEATGFAVMADIFADPFLGMGVAKGVLRQGIKKGIDEATRMTISKQLLNVPRTEAITNVIGSVNKKAGKTVIKNTPRQRQAIDVALDTAEDFADSPNVYKKALRSAANETMIYDAGKAGEKTVQFAKSTGKLLAKLPEKAVQLAKLTGKKLSNLDNPLITPALLPTGKNVATQITKGIMNSKDEKLRKEYENERRENALLKQQLLSMQGQKVFNQPPSTQMTKSITAAPDTIPVDIQSFTREYGGELDFYQRGGKPKVERAADGSTRTTYPDGRVVLKDPRGNVIPPVDGFALARRKLDEKEKPPIVNRPTDTRPKTIQKSTQNRSEQVAPTYVVDDKDGKGRYIYTGKEKTPEGHNPSSPYKTDQELVDAYTRMGIDYANLTDKQAQEQLYDKADPFEKAFMWGSIGNTKQGLRSGQGAKFDKWKPLPNETKAQYKERLIKEGHTAEELNKELSPYKESFADSYRGLREAYLLNPAKVEAEAIATTRPVDAEREPFVSPGINPTPVIPGGEWWLQDEIASGAAAGNFMRVNKYPPWRAKPSTAIAQPEFQDASRLLAANAEMANIGTQGLNAFTNPQQFNAGFSQIQGQGLQGAADILGNNYNVNVGIANDFERERVDLLNQSSREDAAAATGLHNDWAILDQQFDNAKGIRRDLMVNTLNNAITNRAYTANLNQMYPQYAVGPQSGGFMYNTGRPGPVLTGQKDPTISDKYKAYQQEGYDDATIKMLLGLEYGKGTSA